MFRQASQQDNETIDEFHTLLRRLAKHCEYVDVEFEIKMQIVCNGTSSRLRKKALKESNYSLKDMLIDGRKSETCSAQASGMEEKFKDVQLNQVERKPAQSKCYNCGFSYPHLDRPCPAANSTCSSCGLLGHFSRVCRKKESRRLSKLQIAQQSPRQREQPKEPFKSESMRNKQINRVRAVNKHLDSSTETSSEEDYFYTVENKSDPKTRAKIRVNSVVSISLLTRERQLTLSTPKPMIASNPASNYAKVRPRYSLMAQPNHYPTSYPGFSLCGRGLKRTLAKAAEHYVICCIFPGGFELSRRACSQAAVLFIH